MHFLKCQEANKWLLFRTSVLWTHPSAITVTEWIRNDVHHQWRLHQQWLTISLSGNLQPSHVWHTRYPTVPLLRGVQMLPLLRVCKIFTAFFLHIYLFLFFFCQQLMVHIWTFASVVSCSHDKKHILLGHSELIHMFVCFLSLLAFPAQPLHLFRPWRTEQRGHSRMFSLRLHLKNPRPVFFKSITFFIEITFWRHSI